MGICIVKMDTICKYLKFQVRLGLDKLGRVRKLFYILENKLKDKQIDHKKTTGEREKNTDIEKERGSDRNKKTVILQKERKKSFFTYAISKISEVTELTQLIQGNLPKKFLDLFLPEINH